MDFFKQQDKARGLSGYLILLFGFAVLCIIISIFCLTSFAVGFERDLAALAWTLELAVIFHYWHCHCSISSQCFPN